MTRILLVDDHAVVRRGLKQIIMECPDLSLHGEAENGQSALELVRNRDFDVAIVDISMPGRGGLELLKDLRAEKPALKVIILSMHPEEQYAVRCLRDGASAYITKAGATEDLVQAIRAVAGGRRYITPSVAEKLADYVDADSKQLPHEQLSDRELQVFVQLAGGKSLGAIAEELHLSAKTISTYRSRILKKTGLENNSQLIRYAVEHRLDM